MTFLNIFRKSSKKLKDSRIRLQYIIKISIVSRHHVSIYYRYNKSSFRKGIINSTTLFTRISTWFFFLAFSISNESKPTAVAGVVAASAVVGRSNAIRVVAVAVAAPHWEFACRVPPAYLSYLRPPCCKQQAASCATLATLATSLPHFFWLLRLP